MEIEINNCNNIKHAKINIKENTLNIKYGINGTGKTTIGKAIQLNSIDKNELSKLNSFCNNIKNEPEIKGINPNKKIEIFNEEFLEKIVFKEDELIENSYEIFIKNDELISFFEKVEIFVKKIKDIVIKKESELNEAINVFEKYYKNFGKNKSRPDKGGKIGSGIIEGNQIKKLTYEFTQFKKFLESELNLEWVKWIISANDFYNIDNSCPYCLSKDTNNIEELKKNINKNKIKNLVEVKENFENIENYVKKETKNKIKKIEKSIENIDENDIKFLTEIKNESILFVSKIQNLINIDSNKLNENKDNIELFLKNLKVEKTDFNHIEPEKIENFFSEINKTIDEILNNKGLLIGSVKFKESQIYKIIKRHEKEINDFMQVSGYNYVIEIKEENSDYKIRLKHNDSCDFISGGKQHLSFGEKNALSLILFMYRCIYHSKPDLIIFDDPTSSFDKNKKYALLDTLFRKNKFLKNTTSLILTHDFEPIIDIIKTLSKHFRGSKPNASFLKMENNILTETEIKKDDIKTIIQICNENINNEENNELIRIIFLRRYYEIIDDRAEEYQLLSNILHGRKIKEFTNTFSGEYLLMSNKEINEIELKIQKKIKTFNCLNILDKRKNKKEIINAYKTSKNGYEKLQLFRMIKETTKNKIIQKYINQSYHIENDLICQLNPLIYDTIPEFIIKLCDEEIQNLKKNHI